MKKKIIITKNEDGDMNDFGKAGQKTTYIFIPVPCHDVYIRL